MPLRDRGALPLAVVFLVLAAAPVLAAKNRPVPRPLSAGQGLVTPSSPAAGCVLGQTDPPAFSVAFILPPDDQYFTLIDPSAGGCALPVGALLASMTLYWHSNCTMNVDVAIVGADGEPGCWVPRPDLVLCGPSPFVIDGSSGSLRTHTFLLPSDCQISGPAFLSIAFTDAGCSDAEIPYLVIDASPSSCISYNVYPGDPLVRDLIGFYGFPGNPIISVMTSTGTIVAPDAVQAGLDGSFAYDWVYQVSNNPVAIVGLGAENLDNTQGLLHGDGFCTGTAYQPGQTIHWTVTGQLVDTSRSGRVRNFIALCGSGGAASETSILPPAVTPAARATWGRIKVRYH